ncbi:hypothetical protein J6590_063758 [Homalodisca vitripennis]|nr:hypothetical protein J6590_063758 [Homalodisca vitripennis]
MSKPPCIASWLLLSSGARAREKGGMLVNTHVDSRVVQGLLLSRGARAREKGSMLVNTHVDSRVVQGLLLSRGARAREKGGMLVNLHAAGNYGTARGTTYQNGGRRSPVQVFRVRGSRRGVLVARLRAGLASDDRPDYKTCDSSGDSYIIAETVGGQQRYGNTASNVIGLFWCGLL